MPLFLLQQNVIDTTLLRRSKPLVSISAERTGYLYNESKSSLSEPNVNPYSADLISTELFVPAIALMPISINFLLSGCLNRLL